MNNIINKLKTLKELKPDKEWSLLAMAEITKVTKNEDSETSPQLTLLQRAKSFVSIHNNLFKALATSAATAALIIGVGIFIQPEQNNLLIDKATQAEINSILTEREKINSAIRIEVDEDRITEENKVLVDLLRQRHTNRLELQSIISEEIDGIKIRHKRELTDQDIELLLLAKKANQVENFYLALFVLENIRD